MRTLYYVGAGAYHGIKTSGFSPAHPGARSHYSFRVEIYSLSSGYKLSVRLILIECKWKSWVR
jgi:hypothetical protein